MAVSHSNAASPKDNARRFYTRIWRWHFYAGLFCLPFVLWLAITGGIYLFRPQLDAWEERAYDNLPVTGEAALPADQVRAALAAVPGSVLNSYEIPSSPNAAQRILVGRGSERLRIYVEPHSLEVLKVVPEDGRFTRVLFHLHGELLLGTAGSMIVELAASWAIVLIVTGLYLWWPRNATGLGGILYPRLKGTGNRQFLRDLHAVTGFWIAAMTLFLLISGLPWAKSWGEMLKEVRHYGSTLQLQQDWTTGSASEAAQTRAMNTQWGGSEHGEHGGHQHGGERSKALPFDDDKALALNRVIPVVTALQLASPVLVSPPSAFSPNWTARAESQNRPLRANLMLDGSNGTILSRQNFSDHSLLDRIIGYGIAAHEGHLFGWLNVALGVFTAFGLITVVVSGFLMWLRRKPEGRLGAPTITPGLSPSVVLILTIVSLGILLPLLGLSLLLVLVLERWVLRRFDPIARFLGLTSP